MSQKKEKQERKPKERVEKIKENALNRKKVGEKQKIGRNVKQL